MLSMQGLRDNKPVEWNSLWQPGFVPLDKTARTVVISDVLPSALCRASNIQAKLMLSPFPADWVFLRQKQAVKQEFDLRNLSVELSAPTAIDPDTHFAIY